MLINASLDLISLNRVPISPLNQSLIQALRWTDWLKASGITICVWELEATGHSGQNCTSGKFRVIKEVGEWGGGKWMLRMYPTNIHSTTSGINTEARILMGILINILAWEKYPKGKWIYKLCEIFFKLCTFVNFFAYYLYELLFSLIVLAI